MTLFAYICGALTGGFIGVAFMAAVNLAASRDRRARP